MNTGKIFKSKHAGRFTVIPNAILEDQRLSLKAIGLLCYILKLPPDWSLRKSSLHKQLKDGRDLVMAAFTELENCGYIIRHEERSAGGTFEGFNYEVFDVAEKPQTGKPETVKKRAPKPEKPETVKPETEKPVLIKTDNNNTGFTKLPPITNVIEGEKMDKGTGPGFKEFVAIYNAWFLDYSAGVPPVYNGANMNAAKGIFKSCKNSVKQHQKEQGKELAEEELEAAALEGWRRLLRQWDKLDNFTQGKTRLIDINSNFQNIVLQIKKHGKQQSGKNKTTGGDVTNESLAGAVAALYSGARNS